ncbi:MAG: hypothetical protein FWD52_02435 [Candidatus Bathyarchaeota archaeon]|nr:hypothetical protein [Candidatus Termiticorpusculum sp.]
MAFWLNWGSLLLGLVAWLLPIISLAVENKAKNKNWTIFSIASVSACAIAVCMQLYFSAYLVTVKRWASLEDFTPNAANLSLVLIVVTIALNAITLVVYRKSSEK